MKLSIPYGKTVLDAALLNLPTDAHISLIPYAHSTIPLG
jgi:hypothetical protein